METAFGIVLFLLVYVPVAYMVYDQLTGGRSRVRSLRALRTTPTQALPARARGQV